MIGSQNRKFLTNLRIIYPFVAPMKIGVQHSIFVFVANTPPKLSAGYRPHIAVRGRDQEKVPGIDF